MITLRLATLNTNGLSPNKHIVEVLMKEQNLDILLISEAHCTTNTSVKFANYECYLTNHPDGTAHAGTALIVKKTIKHHLLPSFRSDYIQATTIAIEDQTGFINVSAIYCPPRHMISEAMFSGFFKTLGNRFVAGGDWNAKHLSWGSRLTTTRGRQLKLSIDNNTLTAISSGEPTYWPADPNKVPDLLDFFIVKGLSKNYIKAESSLDTPSDHTPVLLTISAKLIDKPGPETLCNRFTDWDSFGQSITDKINLNIALKTPDDIDDATKYITTLIQTACWENTPEIPSRNLTSNYPLEIKKAVLEKRRLRRVWHLSRRQEDRFCYERSARGLKDLLQNWHDDTLKAQLESLTATASTNYSLWKFTKSYSRPTSAIPPIKLIQGWARTPQQKVDSFAEHLANVFRPNDPDDNVSEENINIFLNQDYQMSPPPRPATVREVWGTIKHMHDRKAPGFDLITKEILTRLPRKAIVFLTTLFNGVLRVQYYPLLWKTSQIIMVHKPGKPPNDISSYRPISLLPILSKVFEKILLRRIQPILSENKYIPNHQFGFRAHHSTIEQVHRVYERIRKSLEEKEYCCSAFLDIQQAFDRVWHKGLLYKLKSCLPHSYLELLKSYISERIFQVKESGATSAFFDIRAGVPQGSVMGPVLYTIFTADLPEVSGVTTATFADDTAILTSSKDPVEASQNLQQGIDRISDWLKTWRIKVSTAKCVQVTFTLRRGDCPPVKLDGAALPNKDSVRYLGVYLDRRLTWNKHLKTKRVELNIRYKNLHWILGRNSKLSTDNKLLIYNVVLKPIWMYAIQLWGSCSNSNLNIIQRMQNSILRSISQAPWFIRNTEIHEQLRISTVKEEINNVSSSYAKKLEMHPNELAAKLTTRTYRRRLKRRDILPIHTDTES